MTIDSIKTDGGKGSRRRPENTKQFQDNWDNIFKKKVVDKQSDNSVISDSEKPKCSPEVQGL